MTLKIRQDAGALFAFRPIEGASQTAAGAQPEQLLLDGQQRMTSLYQSCRRQRVVTTITAKKRVVKRWFYIDMRKALQLAGDREAAIFGVPEDRRLKENFDKDVTLDLSAPELEYEQLMYPLNRAFDWDTWQDEFTDYWQAKGQIDVMRPLFRKFKDEVLKNFAEYHVPVISLSADTPHEAVCLVFEKVNTGGKALDAFELLTAVYAAQGHKLRDDWLGNATTPGIQKHLAQFGRAAEQIVGVLSKVAATDFLQVIALLHARERRLKAMADPTKSENDWPAVRASRQSLLDLPLSAYLQYRGAAKAGLERCAKFLRQQQVHKVVDIPYPSQLVPLAAIFAAVGKDVEHASHLEKIARWYWCGVFGELYGSAAESRFARDIMEVPTWLEVGPEPGTVKEGVLRSDRLRTMRTRQSAAYKGIHALLMREGAQDFRTGQSFDQTVFFDEGVDIHHIFPKDWCVGKGIKPAIYDTVINKTPLSYQTNRIIGGVAPSEYIGKLQTGQPAAGKRPAVPPIGEAELNGYLGTHRIDPKLLRADDFEGFMASREKSLLQLISNVTGNAPQVPPVTGEDEGEELSAEIAHDSGLEAPPEE